MKKIILVSVIYILMSPGILQAQQNQNYIKVTTYTGVYESSSQSDITYYDGLGDPEQIVNIQASPQVGDSGQYSNIITPVYYDQVRRSDAQTYLSYVSSNHTAIKENSPIDSQNQFYLTKFGEYYSYAEQRYEASPLNRVREIYNVGDIYRSAAGTSATFEYDFNQANECIKFKVNGSAESASLLRDGFYDPGKLSKTSVTDEDLAISVSYTDLQGRIILEIHTDGLVDNGVGQVKTHYVYDDSGNLCYVLPPELSAEIENGSVTDLSDSNEKMKQFAYIYKYDGLKRCIAKKLPGADWTYMVYDQADRLRFIQDGNMRNPDLNWEQWCRYDYDNLNRQTSSDILTVPQGISRTVLENAVNTGSSITTMKIDPLSEYKYGIPSIGFNSNPITPVYVPLLQDKYLMIQTRLLPLDLSSIDPYGLYFINNGYVRPEFKVHNDYDIYCIPEPYWDMVNAALALYDTSYFTTSSLPLGSTLLTAIWIDSVATEVNYTGISSDLSYNTVINVTTAPDLDDRITGLKFYEKTVTLNGVEITANFVERVFYYDSKGRLIQTVEKNHLGGISRYSTKYDFVGNILASHESHSTSDSIPADIKLTEFEYDHRGRLLSETTRLNDGEPAVVTYGYDDLGKLVSKTYGTGANAVTETYDYNIQGWLTDKFNKYFDLRLQYYNTSYGVEARYTGDITVMRWKHKGPGADHLLNNYVFSYDGLNRLTDTEHYLGTSQTSSNTFTERGIEYDLNGNIKKLKRYSSSYLVDDLIYDYTGNHLKSLTEQVASPQAGLDVYERGTSAIATYSYDVNGNMNYDQRKGLNFKYNFLNLLGEARNSSTDALITKYTFLADGLKVSAVNGSGDFGLEYLGSLVYRRGTDGEPVLESASFGSGRIVASETGSGYSYTPNYFIADHLGSTRVIFTLDNNSVNIVERSNYYPFGTRHTNPDTAVSDNRYRFSGKEDQEQLGMDFQDFGARMYDPTIGRWWSVDLMAEKYYPITPFAYCANNPIRFIDLNGMEFTETAWAWVNKLMDYINNRQQDNYQRIASKQAQLVAGGLSKKQTNRLNRQINRLQNDNASLEVVRSEIAVLAASDQVYNVSESNSLNVSGPIPGTGEDRAGVGFNFGNENVEIVMPINGGLGLFSHELKHAYQFETGVMSFSNNPNKYPSILYDKHDEYEGYTRGGMFRGETYSIRNLPSIYDHLPQGPIDATTHPSIGPNINNPAILQNIANQTKNAFRVNGVTYRPR